MPRNGKRPSYIKKFRHRRRGRKSLARLIRRVARRIPETKYVKQIIQSSLAHNNNIDAAVYPLISGCSQGTGQHDRIGNKISITSIQLDMFWTVEFNPDNIAGTTGIQTTIVVQIWVLTNPKGSDYVDTQDYINSWATNVQNFAMPDPNYVRVLKMRRYAIPLTLSGYSIIGGNNQTALLGGSMWGNFKYSRKKRNYQLQFETNADTVPDAKNYWLLVMTQGPLNLDGVTNFAGAYKYTFKDA